MCPFVGNISASKLQPNSKWLVHKGKSIQDAWSYETLHALVLCPSVVYLTRILTLIVIVIIWTKGQAKWLYHSGTDPANELSEGKLETSDSIPLHYSAARLTKLVISTAGSQTSNATAGEHFVMEWWQLRRPLLQAFVIIRTVSPHESDEGLINVQPDGKSWQYTLDFWTTKDISPLLTFHSWSSMLLYWNSNWKQCGLLGGLHCTVTLSYAHWKVIFSGGLGLTGEDKVSTNDALCADKQLKDMEDSIARKLNLL